MVLQIGMTISRTYKYQGRRKFLEITMLILENLDGHFFLAEELTVNLLKWVPLQ
uniref:Uncharacterized protein n=1 Tax=Rhizophora mucronata TaxID=61149 RepID=A0A2P2PQN4_RHIMU